MAANPAPVIEMAGITKRFGQVLANSDVSFELLPGEIHGLLGENGAGKTTLMNILYGLHQPDAGEIRVRGAPRAITSPQAAISLGLGMVHQHFMQVPTLTVLDNVILGLAGAGRVVLDRRASRRRLLGLLESYHLKVDPDARIWQLPIGERQRVEILKALYREVSVLILDEPTSVLTPQETEELFYTLRKLVEGGLSVVLITHHLEEALAITDRITVLRNGRVMGTLPSRSTTKTELASLMVGREVLFRDEAPPAHAGPRRAILHIEDLHALGDRTTPAVRGVSFDVCGGEIVGVAGVDGNGQSELVQVLAGLRPSTHGRFTIDGRDLTHAPPQAILAAGVGHIPENLEDGLIGEFSLTENLMLDTHYTPDFARHGLLDRARMGRRAQELIHAYDIRAPGQGIKARTLSGGNKQKLIVARELSRAPRLLLAAHPTRGVDIGAEEYIRGLLLAQRAAGMAILLVSTKLDEIMSLSDRILVMYRGRIAGEVARGDADVARIGLLMAGAHG